MIRLASTIAAALLVWSPPPVSEPPIPVTRYEVEATLLFLPVAWKPVAVVTDVACVTPSACGPVCALPTPPSNVMRYRVRACNDAPCDEGQAAADCGCGPWTYETDIIRCTHPTAASSSCYVVPMPVAAECPVAAVGAPPAPVTP